jgi:pyruvate kinase
LRDAGAVHPPLAPRLTKIVATIGPACDDPALLELLLRGGVNVARINLSHGSHAEHTARIARVRDAAARVGVPVAILIDTKGPEVRTAPLAGDPIELAAGDAFLLAVDGRPATRAGTSVSFARLVGEVPVGTTILIDDGGIELRAVAVRDDAIACEVVRGGELGARKSVHVIGVHLSLETLSDADRADLRFAALQQADWIAASFIREADDVHRIRTELRRHGGEIPIVAKIEDPEAVANLASILDAADGAMVARGDLGVLLPVSEVPLVQKRVIRETVLRGKPVITATQMLDSMERNPRPTRAEASDVANAIFDGTSAVMLSGETAKGRWPVEAVHMMVELAREAERALGDYGDLQRMTMPPSQSVTEAVAEGAVVLAREVHAVAIVSLTDSGASPRFVAKYRPPCPIFAVTGSPRVQRRLTLSWGVTPLLHEATDDEERIRFAVEHASRCGIARAGDPMVVTWGLSGGEGGTNAMRVVHVE